MYKNLNPEKALIFRITHRDNLPWIFENGLHCRNADLHDGNFVTIGNHELIDKRQHRLVDIEPGGTLSDYIPFYFTPFSPMMYNIKTGWGGIRQRSNSEIVILVSSLHSLLENRIRFVFTDRHAYLAAAQFSSDLQDLDRIDWTILQNRDFSGDSNDLGKRERYQAEALVFQHMPIRSLLGIVCHNETIAEQSRELCDSAGVDMKVIAKPRWYFS